MLLFIIEEKAILTFIFYGKGKVGEKGAGNGGSVTGRGVLVFRAACLPRPPLPTILDSGKEKVESRLRRCWALLGNDTRRPLTTKSIIHFLLSIFQ